MPSEARVERCASGRCRQSTNHYRQVPSVDEVLFVHTETRASTLVTRQHDGSWKLVDSGPEGSITVTDVELSLATLYARTDDLPA